MASSKRIDKKDISSGIVHIQSSFNNIIVSITDEQGNLIFNTSTVELGFTSCRRTTPIAANEAATVVATAAKKHGIRTVSVYMKGPGDGNKAVIRALQTAGLKIDMIKDITPIHHNGCRPPKRK